MSWQWCYCSYLYFLVFSFLLLSFLFTVSSRCFFRFLGCNSHVWGLQYCKRHGYIKDCYQVYLDRCELSICNICLSVSIFLLGVTFLLVFSHQRLLSDVITIQEASTRKEYKQRPFLFPPLYPGSGCLCWHTSSFCAPDKATCLSQTIRNVWSIFFSIF